MLNVPYSVIQENVFTAIKEDVGDGDITADLIPSGNISLATLITRENSVFCGMDWFEETYRQIDEEVLIEWRVEDGEKVKANQTICTISGSSQKVVTGERVALNFIQTLSATASLANKYATKIAKTKTKILDTRKTIPGLRMAQKYAVSMGGCENHRIGLFDACLIKENHILACDGIRKAVNEARFLYPDFKIEVEVEDIDELEQAIEVEPDRVLLDNFNLRQLKKAVILCKGKVATEASGNITLDNILKVANTGVDYISIGALTKDIKAIDFSLRFD